MVNDIQIPKDCNLHDTNALNSYIAGKQCTMLIFDMQHTSTPRRPVTSFFSGGVNCKMGLSMSEPPE